MFDGGDGESRDGTSERSRDRGVPGPGPVPFDCGLGLSDAGGGEAARSGILKRSMGG